MNWKQLFFSITYSQLIRGGISLFIFVTYIHELPSRYPCEKNFGPTKGNLIPTKYPLEKISKPWNTHGKKVRTRKKILDSQRHGGTIPTRPTIGRGPQNVAHSAVIPYDPLSSWFITTLIAHIFPYHWQYGKHCDMLNEDK